MAPPFKKGWRFYFTGSALCKGTSKKVVEKQEWFLNTLTADQAASFTGTLLALATTLTGTGLPTRTDLTGTEETRLY